jgi:MtN3 and saliva related transmembrane protein
MLPTVDPVVVLGLIAGPFTTVAFVPQVVRTWRLKSANDLSLSMVSLNSAGIFLWLVYGLCVRSLPIIAANLVASILAVTVLVLAIRYREARGNGKTGEKQV